MAPGRRTSSRSRPPRLQDRSSSAPRPPTGSLAAASAPRPDRASCSPGRRPRRNGRLPAGLPSPSEEVVERFLPVAVRAHLLSGSAAPEHRTAAIAFLHFGGLDEVIAREGLAGAGSRLDEVVRLVQDAVERYDVCFLDSDIAADGMKIRLSAGAPRVVGDDEERMLLALRHIVERRPPLPVRVGVHRGPVFTAQVGPAYRRWYAVMGDTVNLAARLMAKRPGRSRVRDGRRVARCEDELRPDQPRSRSRSRARRVRSMPGTWARRRGAPPKARSGSSCRWSAGDPSSTSSERPSSARAEDRGPCSSSWARRAAGSRGCWSRRPRSARA